MLLKFKPAAQGILGIFASWMHWVAAQAPLAVGLARPAGGDATAGKALECGNMP